jgi:hypothetical protein
MSGHHKLVQEPDKIATNTVIGVGVGSLALFAVGIIATYGFLRSLGPAIEPVEGSRQVGQAEMGLVNQLPFSTDLRYYEQRDREMKHLAGYGFVDRKAGTVHIPIEHAMELVTEGVRPAPGPKDATPRARESDEAKSNWPSPIGAMPVPATEAPRAVPPKTERPALEPPRAPEPAPVGDRPAETAPATPATPAAAGPAADPGKGEPAKAPNKAEPKKEGAPDPKTAGQARDADVPRKAVEPKRPLEKKPEQQP